MAVSRYRVVPVAVAVAAIVRPQINGRVSCRLTTGNTENENKYYLKPTTTCLFSVLRRYQLGYVAASKTMAYCRRC